MKYKVGDKVKIKSLDWYYSKSDGMGNIQCGDWYFTLSQTSYCGKVLTISAVFDTFYLMKGIAHYWTDEMIEGIADEPQEKMISLDKACEWLRRNYTNYMINDLSKYIEDVCGFDIFDDLLIEHFRKAMEE